MRVIRGNALCRNEAAVDLGARRRPLVHFIACGELSCYMVHFRSLLAVGYAEQYGCRKGDVLPQDTCYVFHKLLNR